MITRASFYLGLILLANGLWGCYSFSGISIDPSVETYFVTQFRNNASNAPPAIAIDFTEALKEKIRTESRLVLTEVDPDITFEGTIVDYRVTAEAPQPGERTSINRLTIVTAIEYIVADNEDAGWRSNFSFFYDFPSNQNLSAIEGEAIQVIQTQMMEDIFNKAFTSW